MLSNCTDDWRPELDELACTGLYTIPEEDEDDIEGTTVTVYDTAADGLMTDVDGYRSRIFGELETGWSQFAQAVLYMMCWTVFSTLVTVFSWWLVVAMVSVQE